MKKGRNARQNAGSRCARELESTARTPTSRDSLSKSSDSARSPKAEPSAHEPAAELAPVGPHPTLPGRNERGRFIAGNDGHTSFGVFSKKKWDALQPMLHDERVNILDAKGFTEVDADPVFIKIADALVQADTMMHSYFNFLMNSGGPISAKGRTRRAVEGWSRAADRVAKFAGMLGLEKRPRRLNQSPAEWLASLPVNDEPEETADAQQEADGAGTGGTDRPVSVPAHEFDCDADRS